MIPSRILRNIRTVTRYMLPEAQREVSMVSSIDYRAITGLPCLRSLRCQWSLGVPVAERWVFIRRGLNAKIKPAHDLPFECGSAEAGEKCFLDFVVAKFA